MFPVKHFYITKTDDTFLCWYAADSNTCLPVILTRFWHGSVFLAIDKLPFLLLAFYLCKLRGCLLLSTGNRLSAILSASEPGMASSVLPKEYKIDCKEE